MNPSNASSRPSAAAIRKTDHDQNAPNPRGRNAAMFSILVPLRSSACYAGDPAKDVGGLWDDANLADRVMDDAPCYRTLDDDRAAGGCASDQDQIGWMRGGDGDACPLRWKRPGIEKQFFRADLPRVGLGRRRADRGGQEPSELEQVAALRRVCQVPHLVRFSGKVCGRADGITPCPSGQGMAPTTGRRKMRQRPNVGAVVGANLA